MLPIIINYDSTNKYSLHVLLGALEAEGLLNRGVKVYIVNSSEVIDALENVGRKYGRGLVLTSLITTQIPEKLGFLRKLNEVASRLGILSLAGGPHPTGDPYGCVISLGFHVAFMGEAEKSLTEFMWRYAEGGDYLSTRGIAYLNDGKVVLTGSAEPVNLDEYPPYSTKFSLFNPIEISRGCPFACKYCQVSFMFKSLMRHRSVDNVVKYSLYLVSRGIRDVRFITPNSLAYGSRDGLKPDYLKLDELLERLQEVRRRGGRVFFGTFPSEVRPEFVDSDVVKLLKGRVDNKKVVLGAQSGSNRLLKAMGRGHTAEVVLEAVRLLRSAGFGVDVDYIFGLPGETEEDVELTVRHMKEVINLGGRIHAHVFLPLPGTPYVFTEPGRIRPEVRRALFKLLGRGYVYGQWERQEKLATEIRKLVSSGVILASWVRAQEVLGRLRR